MALADAALPAGEVVQLGLALRCLHRVEQLPTGMCCQQMPTNFHGHQQANSTLLLTPH